MILRDTIPRKKNQSIKTNGQGAECFNLECINKMNFSNPQKFLFMPYKF